MTGQDILFDGKPGKLGAGLIVLALATLACGGCAKNTTTDGSSMRQGGASSSGDWGGDRSGLAGAEDWGELPSERGPASGRGGEDSAAGHSSARGGHSASILSGNSSDSAATIWTIVLHTLAGEGHEEMARQLLPRYAAMSPMLREARVVSTAEGSMIVFGRYEGPEDAAAQRDLKAIKAIELQDGRRPLEGILLSRIDQQAGPLHPHDLATARRMYPELRTLYTLQVAAWSDFGSGELSLEKIHRSAEAYAAELRSRGFDAFFHHDDDKRISVVTIGLFGASAIDSESGLFHPDVEMLMRQFPNHMVNGEELQEFINPKFKEQLGTRTQKTMLVEVPR